MSRKEEKDEGKPDSTLVKFKSHVPKIQWIDTQMTEGEWHLTEENTKQEKRLLSRDTLKKNILRGLRVQHRVKKVTPRRKRDRPMVSSQ